MIIGHCADLHITESRTEAARLEEQVEWLLWLGKDAEEQGAVAMLCAGDVFERKSEPLERVAAADVFTAWAARMPVLVVYGNHDVGKDLDFLGRLRTKHQIRVFEGPSVFRGFGASVACLPWPKRANLAARLGAGDNIGQALADALKMILNGFRLELAESKSPTILLSHVELGGAALDQGQPVAGKCEVAIHDHDLLDVGADYVALGHIHKRQTLHDRIHYAGSYRPTTFGQDESKGYSIVTVEKGEPPKVEHRRAPYRPMITHTIKWLGDSLEIPMAASSVGSAVRLVWEVDESNRAKARADAEEIKAGMLRDGIHSVKLDQKISTVHRVRSEEISKARTNTDRIEAWWAARGDRPERAAQMLDKLGELESEASQ